MTRLPSRFRQQGQLSVSDLDSDAPKLEWTDGRVAIAITLIPLDDFAAREMEYTAVKPLAEEGTRALTGMHYKILVETRHEFR